MDYSQMSDDDIRALIDEHEVAADDAREELTKRKDEENIRIMAESRPYLDEVLAYCRTHDYLFETTETKYGTHAMTTYALRCPPWPDENRLTHVCELWTPDDQEAWLCLVITALGNLREWHDAQHGKQEASNDGETRMSD